MIYLVSLNNTLFESPNYKLMSLEEALQIINSWDTIQFDLETSGRNPHLCDILCAQFGNELEDIQIIIDIASIPFIHFKDILESKLLVGHNLKFDIQFCFKYNIIPRKVWDTMIIEQLLYLGFDNKFFHYSLKDVTYRRLGIDLDKSIRGEIIWRGLDDNVIMYAASDVKYLEKIKRMQEADCINTERTYAANLENLFVPVMAYLEWCGICLDVDKWNLKIKDNEKKVNDAIRDLNNYILKLYNSGKKEFSKFINPQLDLFNENLQCNINWNSSEQLIPLFKIFGFNLTTNDPKTGESKISVSKKVIEKQKNINPEFMELYLNFSKVAKDASTYGISYIDAINPKTGRIHTIFKQLGAASGRMSCGGGNKQNDTDLAKFKKISPDRCKFVQLQNLPADELTRSAFISMPGNLIVSCDYSALESRLGADIYNEESMIEEFLYKSGDIHSLVARACFPELKDKTTEEIKKNFPQLRKRAKPIGFSQQFGGSAKAIASSLGCELKEAERIASAYLDGFPGIASFKRKGSKFVQENGYVLICKKTGHRLYWEDWKKWREIEDMPSELQNIELTKADMDEHRKASAKWDRMALNAPTQGSGIICLKIAMTRFFNWIIRNNYFNIVLICNLVHDEAVVEFPENLKDIVPNKLVECMETASAAICTKLPIPAIAEVGDHWIH